MDEEIMTKKEIAVFLKVAQKTIDRWREKGMPCLSSGSVIRFERAKVLEWLENQGKGSEK